MANMKTLADTIAQLGIEPTEKKTDQFERYMEEILSWNEKLNLTAITDREEFIEKHYIDSILAADAPEMRAAKRIVDVGTGAGFPGVPLAILFPEKEFVLMDSLNKRLKVIDDVCEKIGISNVVTLHARAEEMGRQKEHREKYDLCVSRAVANMATLSEYCLPLVSVGGYMLAYKGPGYEEELKSAERAVSILGGAIDSVRSPEITGFGLSHRIVFVKKVKKTPDKYPRKAGTPSKEPLK